MQPAPQPCEPNTSASAWYLRWNWQRAALIGLVVVALVEGYIAVFRRDNDFLFHRNLGTAFLQGDPYGNSGEWYPVGRVMLNAGLAALDYRLSRGVSYALAIASLVGCWMMWRRMAQATRPAERTVDVAAGVATCWLLLPFIVRDLDECGLQLFLLFFLTAGAWAVMRGRNMQGGCWLALAATFKLTPLMCLPFLVWKRRWAAAAWMGLFIVGWNLAPAMFVGWETTLVCNQKWLACMRESAKVIDPAANAVEQAKPHNLSLAGTVGRYTQTYPPGHSLYVDHPAFVQFGQFTPLAAKRTYQGLLLLLGLFLAWHFRRRWLPPSVYDSSLPPSPSTSLTSADAAPEWAIVCLLCALLSPVCWKQHLMVALPCLFLVLRCELTSPHRTPWRIASLIVIALTVYGARHGFVGQSFSIVLLSYKVDTFAMLLLSVLLFTMPSSEMTKENTHTLAIHSSHKSPIQLSKAQAA